VRPPGLGAAAFGYVEAVSRVVMFGGSTDNSNAGITRQWWQYAPATQTWIDLTGTCGVGTACPTPRWQHAWTDDGSGFYVFGGFVGGLSNDLWRLDTLAQTWSEISPPCAVGPNCPAARVSPVLVYLPGRDWLILHGGRAGGIHLADTWAYDLTDNVWLPLCTGACALPTGVIQPYAVYDPSERALLRWGGISIRQFDGSFQAVLEAWRYLLK